jgi:hypothetical protein
MRVEVLETSTHAYDASPESLHGQSLIDRAVWMRCVPGNIWERDAGAMSVTSWAKLVIFQGILEAPPGFEQGWRFCRAIPGRVGRFSEHRDSDFSSDSRQGFENGDVAMLAALIRLTRTVSKLLQQLLELVATRESLRVHELQAWQRETDLRP